MRGLMSTTEIDMTGIEPGFELPTVRHIHIRNWNAWPYQHHHDFQLFALNNSLRCRAYDTFYYGIS